MANPPSVDLSALLNLPPAEAIAWFEAKGYTISWNWHDTWKEANAQAFTVAKLVKTDVLTDIRDAVSQALASGETQRWFDKRLTPLLQDKGWWGKKIVVGGDGQAEVVQEGSPRRLKTIFRTNLQTAYAAGRWKQFEANAADRPYVQYVAIMDGRTRPAHAALNRRVFRLDDPVLDIIAPPNGYNCRCVLRALSAENIAARGLRVETDARVVSRQLDAARPGASKSLTDKRTGEIDPAKLIQRGVSVPDPLRPGQRLTLWVDPGWDYNPGKVALKPFTPPPLDNLPRTFPAGMSLPSLPAPTRVPADRLLPIGLPPQDYARAFLSAFGADIGKAVVWQDVKAEPLVIADSLFQDGAGAWKADKAGRGPYMALLADALKAPDEIWLRWEESRAKPDTWILKRRYLKTFEIDDGSGLDIQYGLTVFEIGKDGWAGSTTMMAQPDRNLAARTRYMEQQRDGFLLYRI